MSSTSHDRRFSPLTHRRPDNDAPVVPSAASSPSGVFWQIDRELATGEGRAEELHAYHRDNSFWRFYRTTCQFRFGYLSFLVLMMIIMFSFTLLMEIFFAIFLPSAKYDDYYIERSILLLVFLPLVLFFLSYFFEEGTRLFFDAINKNDGSLPNFRLAVAVVIHYLRHRKEIPDPVMFDEKKHDEEEPSRSSSVPSDEPPPLRGTKLLLTAKDDPFVDEDKEEEDAAWEESENATDQETEPVSDSHSSDAANRWKRAKMAIKTTLLLKRVQYDGPPIDLSTFLIVDFICPVLFEIVTAVCLITEILASWSINRAFLAYVRMGFWCLSVYLVMWVIAHFWSSRNPKMRTLVSNYRRQRRVMRRAVGLLEREKRAEQLWLLDVGFRFFHHVGAFFSPMRCCAGKCMKTIRKEDTEDHESVSQGSNGDVSIQMTSEPTGTTTEDRSGQARVQRLRELRANLRAKNPWLKFSFNVRVTILSVLTIGAALVSMASFFFGWPLMCICLILLSSDIQKRFPQVFGRTFHKFVITFALLSLIFFSSTYLVGTFVTGGEFDLGVYGNGTDIESTNGSVKNSATTILWDTAEYPVCTLNYDGLSILDFALIADAAYGSTTEIQKESLENRFNGTTLDDWDYVARNNITTDQQVWVELYFSAINMTVVAVRGTASATDALEDMHFWFGILIMQAVNTFIPFLKQLPRAFVVKLLSMDLISKIMPPPVYDDLVDHVNKIRKRVGDNIVLTGHSLGGAMAAMVGAKTKTRAVSFSGPGLLYTRGRFDIQAQHIRDYVLTIKPENDIVPKVDELGGMIQEIRCKHSNPMNCHSTYTHLCELYLACGDDKHRNWASNEECNAYAKHAPVTVYED